MNDKVFESLFITVKVGAVLILERKAIAGSSQAILVRTKHGDSYKIAVVRYKDTGCTCRKCFDAYPEGLVINSAQYAVAIPWDEIADLHTEKHDQL